MHMVVLCFVLLCFVVFCFDGRGHMISFLLYSYDLSISSRVASLALGQSYDCPSASNVTLEDMGENALYLTTTLI